jgi:S1-C subfamily serine protease
MNMAAHFFTKTRIDLKRCLDVDGTLALERYPALHQALAGRVSPQAATLFAEPLVSKGNAEAEPTVSWYSDIDGDGTPLSALDDDARKSAEARLGDLLREIKPLMDDLDDGRLISAALHLRGADSIWVIKGQPVILDWGMLPENVSQDPAERHTHFNATLGRFLPLGAPPPLTVAEQSARRAAAASPAAPATDVPEPAGTGATATQPAVPVARAAGAARNMAGGQTMGQTMGQASGPPSGLTRVPAYAWAPLVLLLLLFGGVLIWLMLPGTRLFQPRQISVVTDARAIQVTEAANAELQARLARLQAAVAGAQCRADGTLTVPGGLTIEGLLPPGPGDAPGSRASADPQPVLPPDPARTIVADAGPLSQANLLSLLEELTAMILTTRNGQVSSTGSGFFVSPNTVVTNFHVIDGSENVYITNRSLGKVHQVQVLKTMGPFNTTGGDFALLQVPGLEHSYYNILQSDASLKLQSVIAAGYPGDVLESDAQFAALRSGDATAVPDMTLTDGVVNTEQSLSPNSEVVVHSAPMSQGNSGGPLVDMCGRVIGVNTFVRQGNLRNLNFALSTDGLIRFLAGTGVQPGVVSQACLPELTRPSVARVAETPATGQSPAAPAAPDTTGGGIPNFAAPVE